MLQLMARAFLVFCLAIATLVAQPEPPETKFVLHGRVQEEVTGAGVAGARVAINGTAGSFRLETDPQGNFEATFTRPGEWIASVSAARGFYTWYEGGVASGKIKPGTDTDRTVSLKLQKTGQISGRLVNRKTKAPLAGLETRRVQLFFQSGQLGPYAVRDVPRTGADGRFVLNEIAPGEYLIDVDAPGLVKFAASRQADYSEEFPAPIGISRTQWPRLLTEPYMKGFRVPPGEQVDLGDIELEPQPLLRMRVALHAGDCKKGEMVRVNLTSNWIGLSRARGEVACDGKFTVTGLEPGSYVLTASNPGRLHAETEIALTGDLDLDLILQTPRMLHGKIEGELPPGVTLAIIPQNDDTRGAKISPEGTFAFLLTPYRQCELQVKGLLPPNVVLEVRYNGTKLPGMTFAPQPFVPEHTLDIKIGKMAAALGVRVTRDDQPVEDAAVLVAPWPIVLKNGYPDYQISRTDADGGHQFVGLRPGQYRVVALRTFLPVYERSDEMITLLKHGEEVELGPSASQTLRLNLN